MEASVESDQFHGVTKSPCLPDLPPSAKYAEHTSGRRLHFICDYCFTRFRYKNILIHHLSSCRSGKTLECDICNIKVTNKGNLARHRHAIHGIKPFNKKGKRFPCTVCEKSFPDNYGFTRHVRRMHFNQSPEAYTHSTKSINDVWVEKVTNTDILMQMRKVNRNIIIMRKCISSSAEPGKLPISEPDMELTYFTKDTQRPVNVKCEFCSKWMLKKSLKKHIKERHWTSKLHECKQCNFKCKRPYQLMKHVCGEIKRRRRQM